MSRVSAPLDSSTQAASDAEAVCAPPAAPPPPPSKPQDAKGTQEKDVVEPHFGPLPRGGSCADSGKSSAAVEDVRKRLDEGFPGFGRDTEGAHQRLEALPKGEYKKALEQMSQEGLLERYVGAMDDKERQRFLAQASEKGLVENATERGARGPLEPPAPPTRYTNDPKLPPELRRCIHEQNLARAQDYCRDYGEYLSRYEAAVGQVESGKQLRELGPPAQRADLSEPGIVASHPDHDAFHGDWLEAREYPTEASAQRAISDRVADLSSEKRAGSFGVESKTKVSSSVEFGAGRVEVGAIMERETDLRPGGVTTKTSGGSLERYGPFKYETLTDTEGKTTKTWELELGDHGSVSLSDKGTLSVKTPEFGGVAGVVEANPTEGDFAAGAETKRKVGGLEVAKTRLVSAHFSGKERAEHALARGNPGVFETPKELEQGKSWGALGPEAKQLHTRNLWSEQEWTEKLSSRQVRGK